jgi:hypothetical protein
VIQHFHRNLVCLAVGVFILTPATLTFAQHADLELVASSVLPDAPNPQDAAQVTHAAIDGTVKDVFGAAVSGASVTLANVISGDKHTSATNDGGGFNFLAVEPGSYRIMITANGFAPWTSSPIIVQLGAPYTLPSIVLQVASASSTVSVSASQHDIAEEQIKEEEKQRVIGILPEFFVSYRWNAAPLTTKQKFELALKNSFDPVSLTLMGAMAGYSQANNHLRPFGQGTEGYAKRFGVRFADDFDASMIGDAILPSIFHQDPRYFVKGTGSFQSRAFHAMTFPFICRGDDGHSMSNYSRMLGTFASVELENIYYPPGWRMDMSAKSLMSSNSYLLYYLTTSLNDLITEFVTPHLTTHKPKHVLPSMELILREGTPVSLVATQSLTAGNAVKGQSVIFALARDLRADGVTVAEAGDKAFGEVTNAEKSIDDVKEGQLTIQLKYLQVGAEEVSLRVSKQRLADSEVMNGSTEKAAGSAKIIKTSLIHAGDEFTVYVAQDVSLHPAE